MSTLSPKRQRLPHGSAKALVAAMQVGVPQVFPESLKNAICSSARYLGYVTKVRQVYIPGARAHSITILNKETAT